MTDNQIDADLSRRSMVKTAAAVAAAGGALALAGPAGAAQAAGSAAQRAYVPAGRTEPDTHHGAADHGVLVRVLDTRLGTLEVYTEDGHHRTVTDRPLAAALARLGR